MLSILATLKNQPERQQLLTQFYHVYCCLMLYLARSILHSPEDAEDAVQDAFVQASRYMDVLEKLEEAKDQRNYLLKITQNAALKRLKKQRQEDCVAQVPEPENSSDTQFLDQLCLQWEYRTLLDDIRQLDPLYRDVLYYRFGLELSAEEIAGLLGRKLPTVKKQIARGKQKLLEWAKESNLKGETI